MLPKCAFINCGEAAFSGNFKNAAGLSYCNIHSCNGMSNTPDVIMNADNIVSDTCVLSANNLSGDYQNYEYI